MDRNREGRRASIVGSSTGGFNRRRHRTNSLRDSPDEDGGVEMQEPIRLRDRVKTDRDRERERDLRERERGRDLRERERGRDLRERSSRSKRRRADRLINGGDDTSEESVNDDEDDEDEETTTAAAGGVRLLTPAMGHHQSHLNNHHHSSFSQQNHNSSSAATNNNNTTNNNNNSNNISSSSNNNHNLQHRKSFPPPPPTAKVFKAPPVWRSGDEIITVSVPRKARSASTKRLQDWIASSSNNINNNNNNNSGSGITGGEASNSPVTAPPPTSSSNPPMRKKLKPNGGGNNSGPKLKPPKVSSSSKPNSSNPEELEIEIAEVLYGLMTQSQAPSSKKEDSRDMNRSSSDTKSRVSSPISNSNSTNNHILGPNSSPFSVVAPKRKRPRQVVENSGYGARSSPVSARPETDQTPEIEISSSNTEKITGSVAENGAETNGYLVPETTALVTMKIDSEVKPLVAEELKESRDLVAKEEVNSPKEKESSTVRREDITAVDSTMIEANSMVENPREFEIDLMAPPPQARSSLERESVDQKPVLSVFDAEIKPALSKNNEDDKGNNVGEEKKGKGTSEEEESEKMVENKGRNIDLRLDLEKSERDGSNEVNASINKQHNQKQQMPIKASREESVTDKSGQPSRSLPLPMSMSGWPGGLPPMGYMAAPMAAAPLQGVVSIDGSTVTPAPVQPPFPQPRPKRCATHCYIARNIHCLQHFVKMNPFWPAAAAGSASLFGSKPCNLNVLPSADLHGGVVNNVQDKGQNVANVSNHGGKDKNSSQSATTSDSAQRKQQILIQQALPPVAPNNLLGPAFIFPINQQQAAVAAAASARPSSTKLQTVGGGVAPPNVSTSGGASTAAGGVATAMSFNYPNMAPNETQYLAILQNGAYPFPIPAMAAPPQNYRGTPGQAMPMFNGSFYSSQMIHPSQLQHQQPPSTQPQQMPQALQNASVTGGSSSSQKHMQSQQPRPQSSGVSGGGGNSNLPKFPNQKSQPPQPFQQSQNQYMHPSQPRHRENEPGSEDSPSRTDGGGPRTSMNLYGQSFPMPMHPQNFALMTQPPSFGSGNQSEKKGQQPQQPGQKTGGDSLTPPHSFAMSFGPMNGTSGPGIDMSSMAQNHAIFQGFTEAARQNIQNIQMMSAAAAAQLARNFGRRHDDGDKSGTGVSTANDDERKSSGNAQDDGGQSIAFTRSDLADASGPVTSSRSMPPNTGGVMNVPSAHIQAQIQQQQMLQLKQQQKHQHQQHQQQLQQQLQQQMTGGGVNRNKAPVTSNGIMYSERLNSTMTAKYPNAVSGFPQNLVQSNNNSPTQSPQWKNSTRTPTPQTPSPMSAASAANLKASMASAAAANLKNLPQQQSRTQQQMHTQISFGGGSQKLPTSQGQAPTNNNSAPAPPMMVGSPTTSSISKGAGGSPRTSTSTSTNNKIGQASSMSAQQPKNSQAIPNQRSSSILGNPLVSSSSNSGAKPQMQQQQQQQMPSKNTQPAQLFFSNPYSQAQPPHSSSTTTSGPSAYYMQHRRWTEQHQQQQQQQQPPGATTSSSGVLSLSPPVTMGSKGTNDPAKAIAAATGNVKGVGLNSQGIIQGAQFSGQLPAGFSYVHPVPAAVQVKPAEQKQSSGNDNMHQRQTDKK